MKAYGSRVSAAPSLFLLTARATTPSGQPRQARRLAMLGASAALLILTALPAHATQLFFEPNFFWQFVNVQGCGYCTSHGPGPWESSLSQAFVDAQAIVSSDNCSGGTCWTALNLHPNLNATIWDGTPTQNYFDVQSCLAGGGGCNYYANTGWIQTANLCPVSSTEGWFPFPTTLACSLTLPAQPPPICYSCIGNPIYAATGQKFEAETDYSGLPGLSYARTYRSTNGFFSSVASAGFLDFSQSTGVPLNPCFYASSTTNTATSTGCLQFIGVAQAQQYVLAAADGRYTQFSGPSSAVTQSRDINERVTQIIVGGVTEWKVSREDDSVEIYNLAGSLIQKTLRDGRVIAYTYSTTSTPASIAPRAGLLLTQSDPFGHAVSLKYNAQGQVSQMTDPAGGVYQYGYDTNGNLASVQYPDLSTRTYSYNESAETGGTNLPHALTGITDESTVRYATYFYDSYGRGTGTQHAGAVDNFSMSYQSASPGATATVTDPLGASRTYQFQSGLSYVQDSSVSQPAPGGSGTVTKSYADDANGNVSQITDYNGNVTSYVFDLSRNLETSRTEASGTPRARTTTSQWDPTWRQPSLISLYAGGAATGTPLWTTAFTYDSLGNVLTKTVTDPAAGTTRVWTNTYDAYGRMLTVDGPRTDVVDKTTYTYYTCTTGYQCGQLQTVTDANSSVTTYNTYNAHGQPLTITDPNGVVTTLTYDARTRLTSRKVGTEQTNFSYWPTGMLKQVSLPDSSYVLYTYDGAHRLTQINDELSNKIVYTLDNAGNRIAEKSYDASSNLRRTHTRVINTLNQVYQDVNAAGTAAVTTTFGYDGNSNQSSIAAPMARNTTNAYDELNRLSQITDPGSGVTKFAYDAEDNLTSVIDPRTLTTGYTYTGFGDLMTQTSPDTGTTTNTYDSGGNLATSTDARGAVSTYTYDVLNRVKTIAYKIGTTTDQTITFTYDSGTNGIGRLTGASDANHSMSWTYDALGRVTGKGQVVGTVTRSVGYGYTNGDLTSLVTPSGQTVVYGYNSNHQIVSITINGTTLLNGVTYEPFGGVNKWSWGNNTAVTTRTYDTDQKITQISSLGLRTNTYDDAFRITKITNTTTGASTYTYGYDLLDRVRSGVGGVNQTFTYDGNGNRLTVGGSGSSTYTVSPTSNRVTGISGTQSKSYTYDAAGNPLTYSPVSLTYNDRGRLQTVQTTSNMETIVYNALGQMVKVSGGSPGTVLYAYDEAGHLIGEYSSTGALIEETVWLGDTPVATLRPHTGGGIDTYYVHTDHLNTPHLVTRPGDNLQIWRWFPPTFGDSLPNTNPGGAGIFTYNLRFPGQIYDSQAGLHQNYFRDFDPAVGRYVESDPIGLKGGLNTYAYVYDSPLRFVDPQGLAIWICSRAVNGFPFVGNHGYLWNDSTRTSCGKRGSSGLGPLGGGEKGPDGGDSCTKVPGSDGLEDQVMSCCTKTANLAPWIPVVSDCQSLAGDCLEGAGLKNPGAPGGRLGSCPSCNTYPTLRRIGEALSNVPLVP